MIPENRLERLKRELEFAAKNTHSTERYYGIKFSIEMVEEILEEEYDPDSR